MPLGTEENEKSKVDDIGNARIHNERTHVVSISSVVERGVPRDHVPGARYL